jgi:hypothetical protein
MLNDRAPAPRANNPYPVTTSTVTNVSPTLAPTLSKITPATNGSTMLGKEYAEYNKLKLYVLISNSSSI